MHQSFRDGFEKTASTTKIAWWNDSKATQPLRHPSIAAQRTAGKLKTIGKDIAGGMGFGKGLMPKAFGLMTLGDVISRTGTAMKKPGGLNVSESFFKGAPA
jgi:hypothetical protein